MLLVFPVQMHAELGIPPEKLRAAAKYWQERSPQVLMLCDKIVQSLTSLLGPYGATSSQRYPPTAHAHIGVDNGCFRYLLLFGLHCTVHL